jgi:uncharacterized protein YcbK (DUF882 family)
MRTCSGLLLSLLSFLIFLPGVWARKATTGGTVDRQGAALRKASGRRARRGHQARAKRRSPRRRYPPMVIVDPNRSPARRLAVRVYDRRGRFRPAVVRQLTRFLRCRRTGRRRQIHPRLIRRLYAVSRHFAGRPLYIYSGYRHPSVSWTRGSFHTKGRAVDFRIKGVSKRRLRDYLMRRFEHAGVGYYTRSPFVHFDLRRRSAFWIDFSGKGERPRYARHARQLLAMERRGVPIRERRYRRWLRRRDTTRTRGASERKRGVVTPGATSRIAPLGPDPERWARVVTPLAR